MLNDWSWRHEKITASKAKIEENNARIAAIRADDATITDEDVVAEAEVVETEEQGE